MTDPAAPMVSRKGFFVLKGMEPQTQVVKVQPQTPAVKVQSQTLAGRNRMQQVGQVGAALNIVAAFAETVRQASKPGANMLAVSITGAMRLGVAGLVFMGTRASVTIAKFIAVVFSIQVVLLLGLGVMFLSSGDEVQGEGEAEELEDAEAEEADAPEKAVSSSDCCAPVCSDASLKVNFEPTVGANVTLVAMADEPVTEFDMSMMIDASVFDIVGLVGEKVTLAGTKVNGVFEPRRKLFELKLDWAKGAPLGPQPGVMTACVKSIKGSSKESKGHLATFDGKRALSVSVPAVKPPSPCVAQPLPQGVSFSLSTSKRGALRVVPVLTHSADIVPGDFEVDIYYEGVGFDSAVLVGSVKAEQGVVKAVGTCPPSNGVTYLGVYHFKPLVTETLKNPIQVCVTLKGKDGSVLVSKHKLDARMELKPYVSPQGPSECTEAACFSKIPPRCSDNYTTNQTVLYAVGPSGYHPTATFVIYAMSKFPVSEFRLFLMAGDRLDIQAATGGVAVGDPKVMNISNDRYRPENFAEFAPQELCSVVVSMTNDIEGISNQLRICAQQVVSGSNIIVRDARVSLNGQWALEI